jgi:hypothetical protein
VREKRGIDFVLITQTAATVSCQTASATRSA